MVLANFGLPSLAEALSQEDLAALRAVAARTRFEDGASIHMRGEAALRLGLVVEGGVRFLRRRADGRIATMVTWGPGQHFGLEVALAGGSRTHDAVAVGPTTIDSVDRTTLDELLAERPRLVRALLDITCARQVALVESYDDLRLQTPAVRLAKMLLLARLSAKNADRIDCSQEDLGQSLALSTVTVGQLLRGLANDGYIQNGYRSVTILDAGGLQAWVAAQDASN